jgi:hypothetical protein
MTEKPHDSHVPSEIKRATLQHNGFIARLKTRTYHLIRRERLYMRHWRRLWHHHVTRHCLRAVFVVAALIALAGVGLGLMMRHGPLRVEGLAQDISRALNERLQTGWSAQVGDATIAWGEHGPGLEARWLKILNPQGQVIVNAPEAFVDVDTWALLKGTFRPKAIGFTKLDLRLNVGSDGRLKLGTSHNITASHSEISPETAAPLSTAVGAVLGGILTAEGAFGSLDDVRLEHARILLVDNQERQSVAFEDVTMRFERVSETHKRFSINVDANRGGWKTRGSVVGRIGKARQVQVALDQVRVNDLLLLSGRTNTAHPIDVRLSGDIALHVTEQGDVHEADVALNAATPFAQSLSLTGRWLTSTRTLTIQAFEGISHTLKGALSGALVQEPSGAWNGRLEGQNLILAGKEPTETYTLDHTMLELRLAQDFSAGQVNIVTKMKEGEASASVALADDLEQTLKVQITINNMNVRPALALWPSYLSQFTRSYLLESLREGILGHLSMIYEASLKDTQAAIERGGAADQALSGRFTLQNTLMQVTQGLPPLTHMSAQGVFSGRRFTLSPVQAHIDLIDHGTLLLDEGVMQVNDTLPLRPSAELAFRLKGEASQFMYFLTSPTLKDVTQLELEPKGMVGQADVKVRVHLPLATDIMPSDIQAQAQGSLTGIGFDKAFGNEKMEDGRFQLIFDKAGLSLKGDGKLGGFAAQIDVKPPTKTSAGEAVASLILDESARSKRGIQLSPYVTGAIPLRVAMPLAQQGAVPRIEADLTKVSLEGLIPGWSKAVGKAGKVAFTLAQDDKGMRLDDIQADIQNLIAKGQVTLSPDGAFVKAALDTFKLSPGDDMRVDVERVGSVTKINIKGQVIDARPFLQTLTSPASTKPNTMRVTGARQQRQNVRAPLPPVRGGVPQEKTRPPTQSVNTGDFELNLTTPILAGHNQEALTGVTLQLAKTAGKVRQFKLNARQGSADVRVDVVTVAGAEPMLVVQSGDGGGILRFIDLYRRMQGGDLVFQLAPLEGRQRGELLVTDFALRNEPALKRIIAEQSTGSNNDRASMLPQARIDASEIAFDRFKADFERQGVASEGRYDIAEAVITGPQVGFTIEGMLDFVRNRMDISGTFVPAYGFNNVFSQVPIFGTILGGGQNEGLFAVNFRVDGLISSPTLTVNPLSALAPGIFRKLFGAGGGNTQQPSAVPPRSNLRER